MKILVNELALSELGSTSNVNWIYHVYIISTTGRESAMGTISGLFSCSETGGLKLSYLYEIWQVSQQHCWVIVQISISWCFEISQNRLIRQKVWLCFIINILVLVVMKKAFRPEQNSWHFADITRCHFTNLTCVIWKWQQVPSDFVQIVYKQGWKPWGILIIKYLYTWIHVVYTKIIPWSLQERRNSIANALELRLSCTNQGMILVYTTWIDVYKYFIMTFQVMFCQRCLQHVWKSTCLHRTIPWIKLEPSHCIYLYIINLLFSKFIQTPFSLVALCNIDFNHMKHAHVPL